MIRSKVSAKVGVKIQLVLAVMVAVVASLTLHHSAMAVGTDFERYEITSSSHHAGDTCAADCTSDYHTIPVCCGMGLCLSGTPVNPGDLLPAMEGAMVFADVTTPGPFRVFERLDRPPKDFF